MIPELKRSPEGRNGNPLQSSCLGIPWTEEPGGLQSMALQKVRHNRGTEPARAESKTRLKDGRRTKRRALAHLWERE